ncbi:AAA family ATPase [Tsukamurella columbiensis]|uniref:AAA family ATPase n=1 Tax=Tsukamurella columbiensis TaxID=128509 RepID=A0ABX1L9U8_9ACTN|nr:AAA family ATPase [Tsukamurella columbiensis]NMD54977.1 AAA family ATPase [Tsukamurella columbiensis]
MIVWLNGGFGAGKTTLAHELHRRIPGAVVYDPEDVGSRLWKWLPRNEDFQDLPSWRELVVAAALSLRRHHAETLIVPMSLLRDAYREEILGGLDEAGEPVLHVFLDTDPEVIRARLRSRAVDMGFEPDAAGWAIDRLDPQAASRQPAGTVVLRSDHLGPADLADAVQAALAR